MQTIAALRGACASMGWRRTGVRRAAGVRVRAVVRAVGAAVALCALGALLVVAAPRIAQAKEYTCPQVDVQAQVTADGTIHITEQRLFRFDGSFSAVWWELGTGLPVHASLRIGSLSMARPLPDGAMGPLEELPPVPFQDAWRDAGGPEGDACAYDAMDETVYAFFDAADTDVLFQLDYEVVCGVNLYSDVAEVYWKFVGSGWAVDSSNVSLALALPVPEGQTAVAGENVRVWAHGPLDGTIHVQEDGMVVSRVANVPAGEFAEVRATFPRAWITDTAGYGTGAIASYDGLDRILQQEQQWADKANRERSAPLVRLLAYAGAGLAGFLITLGLFLLLGREHTPQFKGRYWRDVPDPRLAPAVVGRIWRWNKPKTSDLAAMMMHLCNKGALRMDKGMVEVRGKVREEYCFTRAEPQASQLTDPLEQDTMHLLFDQVSRDGATVWMSDFKRKGQKERDRLAASVHVWQYGVTSAVEKLALFDHTRRGIFTMDTLNALVRGFGLVVLVTAACVAIFEGSVIPALCLAPTGIFMIVIPAFMRRRSRYGAEVYAKSKALKRWLCEFSSLDERPPTDVKVWGEFMAYAYLFGVADKAIRELRIAVPEVLAPAGAQVPWYAWYDSDVRRRDGSAMPSVADAFGMTAVRAVAAVDRRATVASFFSSSGSSESSSGSGSGGGYSSGGGGGFGGGGGAR